MSGCVPKEPKLTEITPETPPKILVNYTAMRGLKDQIVHFKMKKGSVPV
jgi:hypothetical protein